MDLSQYSYEQLKEYSVVVMLDGYPNTKAERISFLISTDYPTESVYKQEVLCGVNEFFVAMPHVQIYHSVFSVGPYDGEIAENQQRRRSTAFHFP